MADFILRPDIGRSRVRDNLFGFVGRLPEDKTWIISVTQYHKPRTSKQRKALFGVAYKAMMEFMGLQGDAEKRQLHWFMCGEYFGWVDVPIVGRKPVRSTTKDERGKDDEISVSEALEFYGFLQRRAAESGCFVPDPDPFWREKAAEERRKAA